MYPSSSPVPSGRDGGLVGPGDGRQESCTRDDKIPESRRSFLCSHRHPAVSGLHEVVWGYAGWGGSARRVAHPVLLQLVREEQQGDGGRVRHGEQEVERDGVPEALPLHPGPLRQQVPLPRDALCSPSPGSVVPSPVGRGRRRGSTRAELRGRIDTLSRGWTWLWGSYSGEPVASEVLAYSRRHPLKKGERWSYPVPVPVPVQTPTPFAPGTRRQEEVKVKSL